MEARFAESAGNRFALESGAEPYVLDAVASHDGATFARMKQNGRYFVSSECAPCTVRYRFALRRAANAIDDLDVASDEGNVTEAPPSTWLLIPDDAQSDARVRFRVTTDASTRFVTGVFPSAEAPGAWDIRIDDLWSAPYSAFGPMRVHVVEEGGAKIELAIGEGKLRVTDDEIVKWTKSSARAVANYLSGFPMPSALVLVVPGRGKWVGGGRTLSGGGGTVFMRVGESATASDFEDDWVLVHEMTHLAFPTMPRQSSWAEEGVATYVEPFARARVGLVTPEQAWLGLVEGFPNGLPRAGDRGLDRTPTWGRTYWGGAIFFFLADVEIRKKTNNTKGLEHAMRGLIDAGGSNAQRWAPREAFSAADKAVGVSAMRPLYDDMATSPHPVDLNAIYKQLGIKVGRGTVSFDDAAPLAHVRRAITTGR